MSAITIESPDTVDGEATVIIPAHTTLMPGTVVGLVSARRALEACAPWTPYAPYDDRNQDGSEVAMGFLLSRQENATDERRMQHDAVVVLGGAEITADILLWGEGVDQARGVAQLAERSITVRD
jgi:Bacteriophage lambda head decoration protein D